MMCKKDINKFKISIIRAKAEFHENNKKD